MSRKNAKSKIAVRAKQPGAVARFTYVQLLNSAVDLLRQSRQRLSQVILQGMTSVYWELGRRIFEHEQRGKQRAGYGEALVEKLAHDLTAKLGRGFSSRNVAQMRLFYRMWPAPNKYASPEGSRILQTPSAKSHEAPQRGILQTVSAEFAAVPCFPLPWSHYVRLMSVASDDARSFYEDQAMRGSWSFRELDRQIAAQYFERCQLAKRKLEISAGADPAESEFRDPYVLEFLNLKDEYSESELEDELIGRLQHFLLELGPDFAFVARQKRLRIGNDWYRIDLVFFHRVLRCLVLFDLKVGKFSHADAGQMNLYLNYAKEHWTNPHENPPAGVILCSERDEAVAHYALGNMKNKVLAREYRLRLPNERILSALIHGKPQASPGRRAKKS